VPHTSYKKRNQNVLIPPVWLAAVIELMLQRNKCAVMFRVLLFLLLLRKLQFLW